METLLVAFSSLIQMAAIPVAFVLWVMCMIKVCRSWKSHFVERVIYLFVLLCYPLLIYVTYGLVFVHGYGEKGAPQKWPDGLYLLLYFTVFVLWILTPIIFRRLRPSKN
jgi:hypothetical protein